MVFCNMDSIMSKVKAYVDSEEFQAKTEQKIDDAISGKGEKFITVTGMNEAVQKFIEVMQEEINSLGSEGKLGDTAVEALTKLSYGSPLKIGKNQYQIPIWFDEDLHRESLMPDKYGGVDNIAALLNSGYEAGHAVRGVWRGHNEGQTTLSRVKRGGTYFIDNAIRIYKDGYAKKYGIVDIIVGDDYK